MPSIRETAEHFFEACETGQGWEACKRFCHSDATFTAQADALAGVDSLEAVHRMDEGTVYPGAGREL